jgi:hypothetical protein
LHLIEIPMHLIEMMGFAGSTHPCISAIAYDWRRSMRNAQLG